MNKELQIQKKSNEVRSNRSIKSIFNKHFMEPVKKCAIIGTLSLVLANSGCATTIATIASKHKNDGTPSASAVACGLMVDIGAAGGGIGFYYIADDMHDMKLSAELAFIGAGLGGFVLGSIPCGIAIGDSSSYTYHNPVPYIMQQKQMEQYMQQKQRGY